MRGRLKVFVGIGICLGIIIIGYLLYSSQEATKFGSANQNVLEVSIINLIATPDIYDGKLVRVEGIAGLTFEGDGIFLSTEDYKHDILKNGLRINLNYEVLKAKRNMLERFNGKYVLVEGIFNKNDKGHNRIYSGSIDSINRYELMKQ